MNENLTNRTQLKTTLSVNHEQLRQIIETNAEVEIYQLRIVIENIFESMRKVADKNFVMMKNKKIFFDRNNAAIYPKFDSGVLQAVTGNGESVANYSGLDFEGYHFELMTENECKKSFTKEKGNPYLQSGGTFLYFRSTYVDCIVTDKVDDSNNCFVIWSSGGSSWYNFDDGRTVTAVPIYRFRGKDAESMNYSEAVMTWLQNEFVPEDLTGNIEEKYLLLIKLHFVDYLKIDQNKITLDVDKLKSDIIAGNFKEKIFGYDFDLDKKFELILNGEEKITGSTAMVEELLNCDKKRANIQPYEVKRLTDINLGHWELFEPKNEDNVEIDLPEGEIFVARPPQLDVAINGTCAIDFGTKSTVVVCRDDDERLLRVGKGNYSDAPTPLDYENPTVIELIDLKNFMKAYEDRSGRPFTEWSQLKVSHEAAEAIFQNDQDISIYDSIFGELKQWASSKDKRQMLCDRNGYIIELKPYDELQEGDFDPIEIYAYYLGLYINNMHNKIYLDYILSFPVTYDKNTREKIRQSFERGLKKSLPPALIADKEMMTIFRVYIGASEPAAYAIGALEEFKLEPQKVGEKVTYGVFDFGGGTTDFDFGFEEIPKNHRRKFLIHRFGAGGDQYLGGENILQLLAYEVFKDNLDEMRKNKITFLLPPQCSKFAGSEMLVFDENDSPQQAHMNNKKISRELRRIWEHHDDINIFDKDFTMKLFSSEIVNGNLAREVKSNVDVAKLESVIENRIRRGVENFFRSMNEAFAEKNFELIHIFLAGNSCRSPIVSKLFNEFKQKYETNEKIKIEIHQPLGMKIENETSNDNDIDEYIGTFTDQQNNTYTISSPTFEKDQQNFTINLTSATKDQQGIIINLTSPAIEEINSQDFDQMRTGKTGVAFGLLRTRIGGKDVKIIDEDISANNEINFPYYLGFINHEKIFEVNIDQKVPYNKWKYFTYADETQFEIYYTKEAKALDNQLTESEVQRVICRIDIKEVNDAEDVGIYVRKISPNQIEYAVGREKDFDKSNFQGKIYQKTLK